MSRPPRLNLAEYTGIRRYFLTCCTHRRHRHFLNPGVVDLVRSQFFYTAETEGLEILAYCFMPDHVHALVCGTADTADGLRFVKLSKQRAAYRYAKVWRTKLWQPGFYDRILRDDDDTGAVIRYIIENPVRARLVLDSRDYAHWGSALHSREDLLEYVGHHSGLRWSVQGRRA